MTTTLTAAGLACVLIALGHAAIGIFWVLPRLTSGSLPPTPLGSSRFTEMMIRVTWHVVTVFALTLAGLFLALAGAALTETTLFVMRWFGGMWLAVVVMAALVLGRHDRSLFRRPFTIGWVITMTALGVLLLVVSASPF